MINRLEEASETLVRALTVAQEAAEALSEARVRLEAAEADLTLSGLNGKNAEARRAELLVLTERERADVVAAEREHHRSRTALTIAEVRHRTAQEIARLAGRAE